MFMNVQITWLIWIIFVWGFAVGVKKGQTAASVGPSWTLQQQTWNGRVIVEGCLVIKDTQKWVKQHTYTFSGEIPVIKHESVGCLCWGVKVTALFWSDKNNWKWQEIDKVTYLWCTEDIKRFWNLSGAPLELIQLAYTYEVYLFPPFLCSIFCSWKQNRNRNSSLPQTMCATKTKCRHTWNHEVMK